MEEMGLMTGPAAAADGSEVARSGGLTPSGPPAGVDRGGLTPGPPGPAAASSSAAPSPALAQPPPRQPSRIVLWSVGWNNLHEMRGFQAMENFRGRRPTTDRVAHLLHTPIFDGAKRALFYMCAKLLHLNNARFVPTGHFGHPPSRTEKCRFRPAGFGRK